MAIVAKLLRSAIFASIAACGSPGGPGGTTGGVDNGGDDPGFVGSGGYGRVDDGNPPPNGLDGGRLFDDGGTGIRDGGTAAVDSSSLDGDGSVAPLRDSGRSDSATELDSGGTSDGDSSVGVAVNAPGGFFVFLDWSISGPAGSYSGRVYFGDARSIEFVAGGIQAGSGYTITLTGTDRDGQSCTGTSAPFTVVAGTVTGAGVLISCPGSGVQANVTTGGVSVDAGVATADM
jgi:hypothetical protein